MSIDKMKAHSTEYIQFPFIFQVDFEQIGNSEKIFHVKNNVLLSLLVYI